MPRKPCHLKSASIAAVRSGWLVLLITAGCTAPPPKPPVDRSLMWPPPPAQPRIAYEASLSKPSDFGIKRGWWKTMIGYVAGNDRHDLAFTTPTGLCLDEEGNLCVTDTGSKRVWFFDMGKKRYKHWDRIGKVAFSSPVAVAKRDGVFYVADSGLGAVVVFNRKGKLLFTITDGLARPTGVVINGPHLYITDALLHRVEVFDLQGRYVRGFGERGTAAGEFNYPSHIASSNGKNPALYITDSMNFRIQKLSVDGSPQQSIGSVGNATGKLSRPKGVATDSSGNLYVVDALFENVQMFDPQGRFLMHWGRNGTAPGYFWLPRGIAIDSRDRVWVADAYNRRIQVFKRIAEHAPDTNNEVGHDL